MSIIRSDNVVDVVENIINKVRCVKKYEDYELDFYSSEKYYGQLWKYLYPQTKFENSDISNKDYLYKKKGLYFWEMLACLINRYLLKFHFKNAYYFLKVRTKTYENRDDAYMYITTTNVPITSKKFEGIIASNKVYSKEEYDFYTYNKLKDYDFRYILINYLLKNDITKQMFVDGFFNGSIRNYNLFMKQENAGFKQNDNIFSELFDYLNLNEEQKINALLGRDVLRN